MANVRHCKIGLLGCGTVGRGLVQLVNRNHSLIVERSGVDITFSKILVRNLDRERPGVDRGLLTVYPEQVINNGCDMVVELVGGLEPARSFIQSALARGKDVVTANKALLAADGLELLKVASRQGLQFGFEGSLCGGIPIVRALQNGLVGNSILRIVGILNGTCNYILTRMADGIEFEDALREAQEKGFAEADPTLDIDGHDAAQKLKILCELAFDGEISPESVKIQGIRDITARDVATAREWGYVIKHIAIAHHHKHAVSLQVHPALVPYSHHLASVREENNAVLLQGDAVGEMLFQGKGAGSFPSASAVLSDIVEIASQKRPPLRVSNRSLKTASLNHKGHFYLGFLAKDASAIAPITTILEKNGIHVTKSATNCAKNGSQDNRVGIFTDTCLDSTLQSTLCQISESGVLTAKTVVLPVIS